MSVIAISSSLESEISSPSTSKKDFADKIKWLDTLSYRLKKIPDPIIFVANISNCGIINRNALATAGGLVARVENIDIDVSFRIYQYSVAIYRNNSSIFKASNIVGNKFSPELISEIRKSEINDKYIFYDVVIETFNKCTPKLQGPEIWIK